MLPKQLKDSQRHQRQPKQVELFLQSLQSVFQRCPETLRDTQRHPETPRAAQSAKGSVPHIVTFFLDARGL